MSAVAASDFVNSFTWVRTLPPEPSTTVNRGWVTITGSSTPITQISNPALTEDGDLTFNLQTPNATSTWAFQGVVAGDVANGTHVLQGGGSAFPGVWQATRQ